MRLKKVMAITLAAGLTLGSIALAANAPSEQAETEPTRVPMPGGIVNPGASGDATEAPSDAPTDAPSDAPTDAPSDAPSDKPTDAPKPSDDPKPSDTPTETPKPSSKPKLKKPAKVTLTKKAVKVSGKKITVTIKKVANATGYQVQYSTKKNFKGAKVKKSTKATDVKLTKLKKGTYYVRVRAYTKSGKTIKYGSYSKTITAKVK